MIHRFYVLCYCQKFNRTDDVTSAGVNSLGVMPVTVARCNSAAGTLSIK